MCACGSTEIQAGSSSTFGTGWRVGALQVCACACVRACAYVGTSSLSLRNTAAFLRRFRVFRQNQFNELELSPSLSHITGYHMLVAPCACIANDTSDHLISLSFPVAPFYVPLSLLPPHLHVAPCGVRGRNMASVPWCRRRHAGKTTCLSSADI